MKRKELNLAAKALRQVAATARYGGSCLLGYAQCLPHKALAIVPIHKQSTTTAQPRSRHHQPPHGPQCQQRTAHAIAARQSPPQDRHHSSLCLAISLDLAQFVGRRIVQELRNPASRYPLYRTSGWRLAGDKSRARE